MRLQKDLREFVALLNLHDVRYLIVGAHALSFHGHPRYTGDLDIFVSSDSENATKCLAAIDQFGLGSLGLSSDDLESPERVIQLGVSPNRIDLLTSLTGIEFEDAWGDRMEADFDDVPMHFLSRAHLVTNKRALGRPRDLADLERLGESIE